MSLTQVDLGPRQGTTLSWLRNLRFRLLSLPPGEISQGGSSREGTGRGRLPMAPPTPTPHTLRSGPVSPPHHPGTGPLCIHGCSGAHELCTGPRSIRQHPVREGSKARRPADSSLLARRGGDVAFKARGGPCERALHRCRGALGTPAPHPSLVPWLCFSARHEFDKSLKAGDG